MNFINKILLLSLSFNLLTFNADAKDQTPGYFYKKFRGSVGPNLNITMELKKNTDNFGISQSNFIFGKYYYDHIGIPISFSGQVNNSMINLNENDVNGNTTGTFKIKFISNSEIKGVWINPTTKKQLNVSLKEQYKSDEAKFVIKRNALIKGNCLEYSQNQQCSSFVATYPLMVAGKNIDKVNAVIQNLITNGETKNIDNYIKNHIQEQMKNHDEIEIITNEKNLLLLNSSYSFYGIGAAHGYSSNTYTTFDLLSGQEIKLKDIFNVGYQNNLTNMAEYYFRDQNKDILDSLQFPDNKFVLPDDYELKKEGIVFHYSSGEIGPYAIGSPQFLIPYENIKNLLRQGTIVDRFTNINQTKKTISNYKCDDFQNCK